MKLRHGALLLLSLGVAFMLSAVIVSCAPDTSAPELNTRAILQTEIPDDQPAPTLVAVVADVPEFTDHECLDCHADETLLMELAPAEEEPTEGHSEGPG